MNLAKISPARALLPPTLPPTHCSEPESCRKWSDVSQQPHGAIYHPAEPKEEACTTCSSQKQQGTRLSARTTPRLSRAAETPPPSLEKPSWLLFRWEGSVGTGMWAACSRIAGKGAAGWWEGCVPLQEAVPSVGFPRRPRTQAKKRDGHHLSSKVQG